MNQFGVNCYSNNIWYSNFIQKGCFLTWGWLISANTVLKFSVCSCFTSNVRFIPVLFVCLFVCLGLLWKNCIFKWPIAAIKKCNCFMFIFQSFIMWAQWGQFISSVSCVHVCVFLRNVYLWDHNLCARMQVFSFWKYFSPFFINFNI